MRACPTCCPVQLSSCRTKLILPRGKCFLVSFAINLCIPARECNIIAISLQTLSQGRKNNIFTYQMPVLSAGAPVTASAGGIVVSTYGNASYSELMLTLLSPNTVQTEHAFLSITEI
jgi:hypothetical protein